MPRLIFPSIPGPPRLPAWPCDATIEDAPSSHDLDITQTRLEPWFPQTHEDEYVASEDGLVCVPRPHDGAWSFERHRAYVRGARMSLVECRPAQSSDSFFMFAKDYEVPGDASRTAEEVGTFVYGCEGDSCYLGATYSERRLVEHQSHPAYQLTLEALHSAGGRTRRICRTDRVVVAGAHVLIMRAEGSRRSFDRYRKERDRFFEQTRFTHLR